jgi:Flp pilus assembly protein TadG
MLRRGLRRLRRLGRREDGTAITEFGLLIPVVAVLLMGAMEAGHTLYVRSVLEGSIQRASRDSGLETGTDSTIQTTIDNKVRTQLNDLGIDNNEITIRRRFYRSFAQASSAVAEPFTDNNGNGRCDAGEPYQDDNRNSTWDADGGDGGQGGAQDTVVYTVAVDYERMFPVDALFGLSGRVQMEGSTVMNNQPYGDQGSYGASIVRNCPV